MLVPKQFNDSRFSLKHVFNGVGAGRAPSARPRLRRASAAPTRAGPRRLGFRRSGGGGRGRLEPREGR
eukprot:2944559-Pyramimonas_sp.AAC.1